MYKFKVVRGTHAIGGGIYREGDIVELPFDIRKSNSYVAQFLALEDIVKSEKADDKQGDVVETVEIIETVIEDPEKIGESVGTSDVEEVVEEAVEVLEMDVDATAEVPNKPKARRGKRVSKKA